jgi:hypothetical protein
MAQMDISGRLCSAQPGVVGCYRQCEGRSRDGSIVHRRIHSGIRHTIRTYVPALGLGAVGAVLSYVWPNEAACRRQPKQGRESCAPMPTLVG